MTRRWRCRSTCYVADAELRAVGAGARECRRDARRDEVAEAMGWPNIIGLGEMMNFPGVVANDPMMAGEIAATRAGRQDGRRPLRLARSRPALPRLCRRRAGGRPRRHARRGRHRPRAPGHAGDAAARLGLVRRGDADQGGDGAGHRPAQLHPLHRRLPFRHAGQRGPHGPRRAPRHRAGAEADDRDPDGDAQHRRSISGWSARSARSRRAGAPISSIVSDLPTLPIERSIARGVQARRRRASSTPTSRPTPIRSSAKNTVKLGKRLKAGDFDIAAPKGANAVRGAGHRRHREPGADARAGGRPAGRERAGRDGPRATTSARSRWSSAIAAPARWSTASSRASATCDDCAVASTVAHDSHHMIVVGTNKADMALAANRLGEVGGGVVVISEGKELALVELPIAGLMSDERAEIVAAKAEKLVAAMRAMRLHPQQRLHAALAAGAGGHPRAPDLRRRPHRRDDIRQGRSVRVTGGRTQLGRLLCKSCPS